jgi:hypothetical protein
LNGLHGVISQRIELSYLRNCTDFVVSDEKMLMNNEGRKRDLSILRLNNLSEETHAYHYKLEYRYLVLVPRSKYETPGIRGRN